MAVADTADLGLCPICGRPMRAGPSVDRHHLVPKSEGGRESRWVHRICHRKVHSLFTERELAKEHSTPEALRAHPEMQALLRWIVRKDPEFYSRTATAHRKAGRRR